MDRFPLTKSTSLQLSQGQVMFKQSLIHLQSSLTPKPTKQSKRLTVSFRASLQSEQPAASMVAPCPCRFILQPWPGRCLLRMVCFCRGGLCSSSERERKGWRLKEAVPSIKHRRHLQCSLSLRTLWLFDEMCLFELLTLSCRTHSSWVTLLKAQWFKGKECNT